MQRFSGNISAKSQSSGFSNFREIYRKPLHIISEPTVEQQFYSLSNRYETISRIIFMTAGGNSCNHAQWVDLLDIIKILSQWGSKTVSHQLFHTSHDVDYTKKKTIWTYLFSVTHMQCQFRTHSKYKLYKYFVMFTSWLDVVIFHHSR